MSDLGRRIKAARAYAGIGSQTELGRRLGGISQSKMQRIESGGRELAAWEQRMLLRAIAEECGLPYEFFTADFTRLAEIAPEEDPSAATRTARDEARQREADALREKAQQRIGRPEAVPDTTPAPRRRGGQAS